MFITCRKAYSNFVNIAEAKLLQILTIIKYNFAYADSWNRIDFDMENVGHLTHLVMLREV